MVPVDSSKMRDFWDDRAREDAFYFVDNRQPYRHTDEEQFWREGERDLDTILDTLGLKVEPTDHVLDVGCGVGRLTRVLALRPSMSVTPLAVSGGSPGASRRVAGTVDQPSGNRTEYA